MTNSSGQPDPNPWADVPPMEPPVGDPERADHPAGGYRAQGGPGSGLPPEPIRIRRRRRRATPALAAVLVTGAVAAGVGAGHVLWPTSTRSVAEANTGASGGSAGTGTPSRFPPFQYGDSSPYGASSGPGSSRPGGYSSSGSSGSAPASGAPSDPSAIAARVSPGLVDINTSFGYQGASGAGTGIVLTSRGEILTNNHVINGATAISVTDIGNGRTYRATVVGYDRSADVAVLQLRGASGLETARIGRSSSVQVGEPVVAVGNAGGVGGRPSSAGGAVTALDQAITAGDELTGTSEQLSGMIEVSADVQPGDSGGSLVDSAGQVIGMDTAASSGYSLQSSSNQGFAIPIDAALALAHQMEAGRSSPSVHVGPTAFLGVGLSARAGSGSAGGYSLPGYGPGAPSSTSAGAWVSSVVPGGAAASAGLQAGDAITSVDSQSVSDPSALSAVISQDRPGDSVRLGWTDPSGMSHTATVVLGSGPPA